MNGRLSPFGDQSHDLDRANGFEIMPSHRAGQYHVRFETSGKPLQDASRIYKPTGPDDQRDVSIAHDGLPADRGSFKTVVTVPTFRRPEQLEQTLRSLEKQHVDEAFAIVVMDNDAEERQGADTATTFLNAYDLPGLVVVAHRRGNCHAYNAGWQTVLDVFTGFEQIAVLDDDEIADPDWLRNLLDTRTRLKADIVGAPQVPVFAEAELDRWRRHPVFMPPYDETGIVPILYSSGNVMIGRNVLEVMPRPHLDPVFNFIGGGDADFYSRCREKGFRFAWCMEAPVYETIPRNRTESAWLGRRSRREGAISAMIDRRRRPDAASGAGRLLKSGLLLAASVPRGLLLWSQSGSPVIARHHFNVAVGRFIAEFGSVNEQYRQPD